MNAYKIKWPKRCTCWMSMPSLQVPLQQPARRSLQLLLSHRPLPQRCPLRRACALQRAAPTAPTSSAAAAVGACATAASNAARRIGECTAASASGGRLRRRRPALQQPMQKRFRECPRRSPDALPAAPAGLHPAHPTPSCPAPHLTRPHPRVLLLNSVRKHNL